MESYVFRDPAHHIEEIKASYDQFMSLADLYIDRPNEIDKGFLRLLYDLSHIIHHHEFGPMFANKCILFIETLPESLPSDVRVSFVQALIVLHNHDVIETTKLISHLAPLFRLNDKTLRRIVFGHLYNRLMFHQTNETKKELQKFVSHEDSRVSFKVLQLIIDLFHKENKEDPKTVNFIARSLNTSNTRLLNLIISFFLDPYLPKDENDLDEAAIEEIRHKAEHILHVNKKNKKNEDQLKKAKKLKAALPQDPVQVIDSLDDPQRFALRLFSLLSAPENSKIFKVRESQLRAMALLSKIIAQFQLDMDQFFSWAQRFIRTNYEEITKLLSIVAGAVHPLTSPDTVYELIKIIADRFVVEHLDEEILIVGMNTIREICSKNPHGMTPELLEDLVMFKKEAIKGVVMAARGIIQVFRELRPDILPKKERGKPTDTPVEPLHFGETKVENSIEGIMEIAKERPLTDEELRILSTGSELPNYEVDEGTLLDGSKIRRATKEEKLESALAGKPEKHTFRDKNEDKTGGFSNKDKIKFKPFMLTRFRAESGHHKMQSLNMIQKQQKLREGRLKMKMQR